MISVSGFDCEIKNVYFRPEVVGEETTQAIIYQYMATDEANAYTMALPELVTISSEPRSHITHMNLYGKSQNLKIKLFDLAGQTIRMDEIRLNVRQPLQFSKLRAATTGILVFLAFLFLPGSALYQRRYLDRCWEEKICILLVMGLVIGLFVGFSLSNPYMMHRMNNTNRQYQELAECIWKGQFYLDTPPDGRLASLANPYDMDVRYAEEIAYRWDVAYFEGKYYVYFGVVPCLLFYLPYYLLTGEALVNYPVVIVEEILFCIGVFYLYHVMIRRYFKKTSVAVYCLMA
ncbi:MAG: hypothetical protein J6I64_03940, partial [Lachnospiraceae bacterium]|nr:hypothetical protein [Lachnospiraceae bacterium]